MRIEQESDHWYSPVELLEFVLRVFGRRWFDPTTCKAAVDTTPAHLKPIWIPGADFLALPTLPFVAPGFMNPPYSKAVGGAGAFNKRAIDMYRRGELTELIIVVNANTGSGWFHDLISTCDAACFRRGREKFDMAHPITRERIKGWDDGKRKDRPDVAPRVKAASPRYDNVYFYFGENADTFRDVFSEIGSVVFNEG